MECDRTQEIPIQQTNVMPSIIDVNLVPTSATFHEDNKPASRCLYINTEKHQMASKQVTKRLLHELRSYEKDPSDALLHLGPINDEELTRWTAVLKGVSGTAYQNGLWKLNIVIPDTYPNKPPTITFVTPICHPNVHFKTGEICLDLLKSSWSPVYSVKQTLEAVQQLLTSAEPDSPLNIDAAQLLRQGDQLGYEALVRFYTETLRWNGE
ncbi:hypothetical protein QM012_004552 [Aureobasidium pullulans]|uniref:UBC core domain-containing protein n=1 Tax=Aureobasidium pullulans TaxID=5580 RepID=A0ABR0TTC6_AURPU